MARDGRNTQLTTERTVSVTLTNGDEAVKFDPDDPSVARPRRGR